MGPRERILAKLAAACAAHPQVRIGALLEAIEERAWDTLPQRHCSMRLQNMPDELLEYGLDLWMKEPRITPWIVASSP